jgi:chromosome segregation ATPase
MPADFWANVANEISKLNEQLREAHETIADILPERERAIADRDRLETLARERMRQLELLKVSAKETVEEYQKTLNDLNAKDEEIIARDKEISELKENIFQLKRQLEAAIVAKAITTLDDAKFVTAKREFAKLYHPNNSRFSGIEKLVRAELFKEFWEVLERIDNEV